MLSSCPTAASSDLARQIFALQPGLYRFAVRLTSRAEAEDVVQETFARLLGRGEFSTHANDHEFLRRVAFGYARIVALEGIRKRALSGADPSDLRGATPPDLALIVALQRGFSQLSPDDRELLWAADVEGIEQLEIAEAKGVPSGTVRSRVTRARQRLASWIDFGTATPPSEGPTRSHR